MKTISIFVMHATINDKRQLELEKGLSKLSEVVDFVFNEHHYLEVTFDPNKESQQHVTNLCNIHIQFAIANSLRDAYEVELKNQRQSIIESNKHLFI